MCGGLVQVGTLLHSVDESLCGLWTAWCIDNQRRVRARLARGGDVPALAPGSAAAAAQQPPSRAALEVELNGMIAAITEAGASRGDDGVVVAGDGKRYYVGDAAPELERLWRAFVGPVAGLPPATVASLGKAGRFGVLLRARGGALLEAAGRGAEDGAAAAAAAGASAAAAPDTPGSGVAGAILGGGGDGARAAAAARPGLAARTSDVERALECLRNAAKIERAIRAASRVAGVSFNDGAGAVLSVPILTEHGESDTECNARISVGDAVNRACGRGRGGAACVCVCGRGGLTARAVDGSSIWWEVVALDGLKLAVCIRPSAVVRSAGPGALLARIVPGAPGVARDGARYDRRGRGAGIRVYAYW